MIDSWCAEGGWAEGRGRGDLLSWLGVLMGIVMDGWADAPGSCSLPIVGRAPLLARREAAQLYASRPRLFAVHNRCILPKYRVGAFNRERCRVGGRGSPFQCPGGGCLLKGRRFLVFSFFFGRAL